MRLPFGLSSYRRDRGDMPELPVLNMFAEEAPTEDGQVVLQSRPGLSDRGADMGAGPVKQLFRRDGVLGGDLLGVSGGNLYRGTTLVGSIPGSGAVSMAGNEIGLMVAAGSTMRFYDGSTIADVAFPDSANVSKVAVTSSRFVSIRADTGKFYWTEPLGSTVDPLAFATAESAPDRALDLVTIDDVLVIFGAETVEFWPNTTDADLPFAPIEGRVIEKGIRATGCATTIGATFAWVTNENTVCISDENNIVSNAGLQARIEASAAVSLFTFLIDGVEFLALRLDNETQVYNPRSGLWCEFTSYGLGNWIAQCADAGVFGSASDGKTLAWGGDHLDLGGVLERRFRAGMNIDGGAFPVARMQLRVNVGQTPFLTGDYVEPQVEMRLSPDAGQTWDDWEATNLGRQGDYTALPEWRALGIASYPGLFAEFRCTDPVPFRVSAVLVNEKYGGR